MSLALISLTVDFFHYVPIFSGRLIALGVAVPAGYLKYTSIFDLILETLLGFGTVMTLTESVRDEIEKANRDLTAAHDKLERIARLDPLTEALNRYAFYSLVGERAQSAESEEFGCAAVIDMDNLNPLNDSLGHTAGDQAIRAVARSVRSLVRADDLLFRWGGDEFLLLTLGIPQTEARQRLESLNGILSRTQLPASPQAICISVSYGLAAVKSLARIEEAIETADKAMYDAKQRRKTSVLEMCGM